MTNDTSRFTSSRFAAVSRRAFMKGTLAAGFVAFVPLSGCSNNDKAALATPSSGGRAANETPGSTSSAAATAPATVAINPASTAAGATAPAAGTFPAGGKVVIDFTYSASSGGRVNNPFIAVWIEDAGGALVRTVSLWFKTSESKYLQELQRWYSVDQGGSVDNAIDTVSGATRVAGRSSVAWDGTDHSGATVAHGEYFVCVEAAREHGPYELVRGPITIGATPTSVTLTPNGELTAVTAQFVV